jgi:hypothetical protein
MGLQTENTRSGLSSPGSIVGFEACSPKPPAAASATRSTSGVRPPRAPLGPSLCRELPMKTHRVDIHQHVTDKIVSAIERGGEFRLPWYRSTGLRRHLALVHRAGKSAHVGALHGARQAVVAGRVLNPAQHGGLGGDPFAPDLATRQFLLQTGRRRYPPTR